MIRNLAVTTVFAALVSMVASPAWAQFGTGNLPNNLFSQYSTQPGASMVQAGMYPAPHDVPAYVGHSYYTYQPLMPHEMMYVHSRNYYNYYNTGGYYGGNNGLNITRVRWQSGCNHMGPLPFSRPNVQSMIWNAQKRRYCIGGDCGSGSGGRRRLLHRHLGCASGQCGSESGEVYDGGYDAGGYDSGADGGCAGGCVAKADQEEKRR